MDILAALIFIALGCIVSQCSYNTFIRSQPKSLKRKLQKPSTSTKPISVTNFFSVIPAASGFKCVAPSATGRCGRSVKKESRKWAHILRRTLSSVSPSDPRSNSLLDAYAEHCLCWEHIRSEIIPVLTGHWSQELNAIFGSLPMSDFDLTEFIRTIYDDSRTLPAPNDPTQPKVDRDMPHVPGCFEACSVPLQIGDLRDPAKPCIASTSPTQSALEQYRTLFRSIPQSIQLDNFAVDEATSSGSKASTAKSAPWGFIPYTREKALSLKDVIASDLCARDRESGHLYMFTREDDEEFIKIGYTTSTVAGRLKQWERDCKYRPIRLWDSGVKVPHARRVETLVHVDLESRSFRQRESRCKTNPDCEHAHGEWFKISKAEAIKTIEYWIGWMGKHEPYNLNGQLKESYVLHMILPGTNLQILEHEDALHFISDSSGQRWTDAPCMFPSVASEGKGAETNSPQEADVETSAHLHAPAVQNEVGKSNKSRRTCSESSSRSSDSNQQSRRSSAADVFDVLLTNSLTLPKETHEWPLGDTPSKPSRISEFSPSRRRKSAPSGRPIRQSDSEGKRRRASTPRNFSRHSSGKVDSERTSPPAPASQNAAVGSSILSPIIIESDSDDLSTPVLSRGKSQLDKHKAADTHVENEEDGSQRPKLVQRSATKGSGRRRSAPSTVSPTPPSYSGQTTLPKGRSVLDLIEEHGWHCPRCTLQNDAYSSICQACQYVISEFDAMEDGGLPAVVEPSSRRRSRPRISHLLPASDPVLPLAREDIPDDLQPASGGGRADRSRKSGKSGSRRRQGRGTVGKGSHASHEVHFPP